MDTCFIFYSKPMWDLAAEKKLQEDNQDLWLSLRLNQNGNIDKELSWRRTKDLLNLQENAKTLIVVSARNFSFHHIELPWINEKKARIALPFALEEKLAENLSDLHFAFSKDFYRQGKYLVVVTNKAFLSSLIAKLNENKINFSAIYTDWFALDNNEACISDYGLIVSRDSSLQGALSPSLADLYLQTSTSDLKIIKFLDSDPLVKVPAELVEEKFHEWLARRLSTRPLLNLCQGDLEQSKTQDTLKYLNYFGLGAGVLWFLLFVISSSLTMHFFSKELRDTELKIAKLYREFFPEAKEIISPRARISQVLKAKNMSGESNFWLLMNALTLALKSQVLKLENLRFQNQGLALEFFCKDFATLEYIQNSLQKEAIKVKQEFAEVKDGKVQAKLVLNV